MGAFQHGGSAVECPAINGKPHYTFHPDDAPLLYLWSDYIRSIPDAAIVVDIGREGCGAATAAALGHHKNVISISRKPDAIREIMNQLPVQDLADVSSVPAAVEGCGTYTGGGFLLPIVGSGQ